MDNIIFRIFRFTPGKDKAPFYQEYKIDYIKGATILDTLNQIKWTQDGTLTYRMSCRSAICGSCAVRVNGRSMLTCKTQVADIAKCSNTILIEPLKNMNVIRDLAVDWDPFWKQIENVDPWLKPADDKVDNLKERHQSIDDFHKIDESANCIMCGSCFSDCSVEDVDSKFLGPAALAKAQRFVEDSRDTETRKRVVELTRENGIWDCTHCFECVEACPKGVKPLDKIVNLRTISMKEKILNNNGARHAKGFFELVRQSGILDENKLPLWSINIFSFKDLFGLIPMGLRMLFKGKIPPIIHKPIEKHTEIKRIYKKLEKKS